MNPEHVTIVVPMEGVTAAIVAFIFVGVAWPRLIKNKTQFYAAFTAVCGIIILYTLDVMIRTAGFQVFAGAITGLLQLFAFVMLFMSAGGLSAGELKGELKNAYEVIRRGEEEKQIIVPLTGEQPGEKAAAASAPVANGPAAGANETPAAQRIDLPLGAGWPKKTDDSGSLPLE